MSEKNQIPDQRLDDSRTYQVYLIRLWRDDAESEWRASVQSAARTDVVRFGRLSELYAFLHEQAHSTPTNAG